MHAVLEYTYEDTTLKPAGNTAQTTSGRGGTQSNAANSCWVGPPAKDPSKDC